MPSLTFLYGTMNSSKTANLLMAAYTHRSQGKTILLTKPSIDTRGGKSTIKSRVGLEEKVDFLIYPDKSLLHLIRILIRDKVDIILVDEAQFLSVKNVEELRFLSKHVPIICYGLLTDYRTKLFPGSQRLIELSDYRKEIRYTLNFSLGDCTDCKKNKAIVNAKYQREEDPFGMYPDKLVLIREGSDKPDLGAEEKYKPLCWQCWSEKKPSTMV